MLLAFLVKNIDMQALPLHITFSKNFPCYMMVFWIFLCVWNFKQLKDEESKSLLILKSLKLYFD